MSALRTWAGARQVPTRRSTSGLAFRSGVLLPVVNGVSRRGRDRVILPQLRTCAYRLPGAFGVGFHGANLV